MNRCITDAVVCVICIFPLLCGCGGTDGPDMGQVTGVVRLDGQPLPNAQVTFIPQAAAGDGGSQVASGSTSIAITDDQGRYELQYSSSKSGAVAGKHTVRISTFRHAGEDEEGNATPGAPEKVPAQYNLEAASNPEMQKEVKPGPNEINFDLKSGGQIFQPPKADDD